MSLMVGTIFKAFLDKHGLMGIYEDKTELELYKFHVWKSGDDTQVTFPASYQLFKVAEIDAIMSLFDDYVIDGGLVEAPPHA